MSRASGAKRYRGVAILCCAVVATARAAAATPPEAAHAATRGALGRPRLLDDPGGYRGRLERAGIYLDLYFNHFAGANVAGDGRKVQRHSGSADLFLRSDLERSAGLTGTELLLHVKSRFSKNVNPKVDALSDPIDDADGDTSLLISQLWVQQAFSRTGPLPGSYRVGGLWDPREREVFRSPGEEGKRRSERDDLGFYLSFDQMLYREARGRSDGAGVFLRYGHRDGDVNRIEHFWSAGAQYQGPIPSRGDDVVGFGVYGAHVSERLRAEVDPELDWENGYELYYSVQLTPWLAVTPDVQYLRSRSRERRRRDHSGSADASHVSGGRPRRGRMAIHRFSIRAGARVILISLAVASCRLPEAAPGVQPAAPPSAMHAVHDLELRRLMRELDASRREPMPQELDVGPERDLRLRQITAAAAAMAASARDIPEALAGQDLGDRERVASAKLATLLERQARDLERDAERSTLFEIEARLEQIQITCDVCHTLFRQDLIAPADHSGTGFLPPRPFTTSGAGVPPAQR